MYAKILMGARTRKIVTIRAESFLGTVRWNDSIHVSRIARRNPTVPIARTRPIAETAYAKRRKLKACSTPVVSLGCGRRAPGATAQHSSRSGADGRGLRELRERHLLAVRVHAHLRADRRRHRGGRCTRRGRFTREHVVAVLPGTAGGDAGFTLEVVDAGGDPQPARSAAPIGHLNR